MSSTILYNIFSNKTAHRFAEAAFMKEGKKWEANAFADVLLEYALPLERLVAVYVLQQYQLSEILDLKVKAVVKNAEGLLSEIEDKNRSGVTDEEDEENEILIDQLKQRVNQVQKLKHEVEKGVGDECKHVDQAYLSCLFLDQETKSIKKQVFGGQGTDMDAAAPSGNFLANAIKFDRVMLNRRSFRRWVNWVVKVKETRKKANNFY